MNEKRETIFFFFFRFCILAIDDYVMISYEKCVEKREQNNTNKVVMMLKENE